jgi:hypothetical protein
VPNVIELEVAPGADFERRLSMPSLCRAQRIEMGEHRPGIRSRVPLPADEAPLAADELLRRIGQGNGDHGAFAGRERFGGVEQFAFVSGVAELRQRSKVFERNDGHALPREPSEMVGNMNVSQ